MIIDMREAADGMYDFKSKCGDSNACCLLL